MPCWTTSARILYTPRCFHRTLKRCLSSLYASPQVNLRAPTARFLVASQCHPCLDLRIPDHHHQVITDTLTHIIPRYRYRRHLHQYTNSRDSRRPMDITSRHRRHGRASGTVSPPPLVVRKPQSSPSPHHFPPPRTAAERSVNLSTTRPRPQTFPTVILALVRGRGQVRDRQSKHDGIHKRQCRRRRCLRGRCNKRSHPRSR